MDTYEHVGVSSPIHNGVDKATGRQIYVADRSLPHMHYAKLVYSTIPHGKVTAIDVAAAKKVPGVAKIFTCFNTTQRLYSRVQTAAYKQDVLLQENLFPKQVRFIGDRVAMVVAATPEAAEQAAALIKVTYEALPSMITMEQAMDKQAVPLHSQGNVYACGPVGYGDKPMAEDIIQVETKIRLPRLHHAAMEPHGCVADYQPGIGKLTVWTPCQSVFGVRNGIATLFDLPYNSIQVIQETMGGSFGSKQENVLEPLAALAALTVQRPVQLVLSREEAMHCTMQRADMRYFVRSYVKPNGKIVGVEVDCTINAGAYLTNSHGYLFSMLDKLSRIYDFPYASFTGRAVCTNTPVSGSYRSWGSSEIATALEHHMNVVAKKLSLDPVDLRLQNTLPPNSPHRMELISIGNCRIADCLQLGREKFQWQQEKKFCEDWNRQHKRYRYGIGMACGAHINGFYPSDQERATVGLRMNEDGTVHANVCVHDHGCGTVTAFRKLIAEVLAIDEQSIMIGQPDTDQNYNDYGCYGSRTTYVVGRAAKNCAEQLLEKIKGQAALFLGVEAACLRHGEGFVFVAGQQEKKLAYREIVQKAMVETQQEIYAVEHYVAASNPSSNGAHFAKVKIDCYTGLVKVEKYLAVHDLGKAVNPAMCQTQIGGAVQQGIGAALQEEIIFDTVTGKAGSSNLNKYHLVNVPDMPDVETSFVEKGGDQGPFGAKSIGEVSLVPVVPAVLNAVAHGLDKNIVQLPVTPQRLLALLTKSLEQKEAQK